MDQKIEVEGAKAEAVFILTKTQQAEWELEDLLADIQTDDEEDEDSNVQSLSSNHEMETDQANESIQLVQDNNDSSNTADPLDETKDPLEETLDPYPLDKIKDPSDEINIVDDLNRHAEVCSFVLVLVKYFSETNYPQPDLNFFVFRLVSTRRAVVCLLNLFTNKYHSVFT